MGVNATLLVQALTFAVMVWLMKRTLWDPLMQLMKSRRACIAHGAAAAERGHRELELAEQRAREIRARARAQADDIVARADRAAVELLAAVRAEARAEADRLLRAAKAEIRRDTEQARGALRAEADLLAALAAERVLDGRGSARDALATFGAARPDALNGRYDQPEDHKGGDPC